ncbi:MAG TPA: ATP-binding protein [Bacteroidia bacterium]|jgi:signal transduction histidine kinase/CheY-like chemotaxis protein/HPt (histidine-containing phosphotransfer) domain-containing protein|nr:ATP-binding protein [Bacteroidia bacterium]
MFKSIKIKILLSFSLAILLIAGAGVLTYRSVTRLGSAVSSVSKPDLRLQKIEQIQTSLAEAESGLRAYALSLDDKYLEPYERFLAQAEAQMDTLRNYPGVTPMQLTEIHQLDSLLNEKLDVFFKFLNLKTSGSPKITLTEIADKLKQASSDTAWGTPKRTVAGRLRSLFNLKEPDETTREKESRKAEVSAQRLEKIIRKADQENEKQTALLSHQELELLQRDAGIMAGIRKLIRHMETEERIAAGQNLSEANFTVLYSSRIIQILTLGGMLVLMVFTYFIFADISRSNRYKKALEESKKKTEELAKVKEEFLANMSHEIRTPLNAIIGFAGLLRKSDLEGSQKKYLEGVDKSSEHLLSVVNDILDFSKIEAGKLHLEHTGFQLTELLVEVTGTMRFASDVKKLRMTHSISDELMNTVLLGDPFRIKQVLLNLLSNAIKFTEEGKIQIRCSSELLTGGHYLLKFEVEDTGIGIPESHLNHIFDEFTQADNSVTRKYGGSGLGLAICRKLAHLLHGDVSAVSTPGKGSVFTFTARCEKGTYSDLAQNQTPDHGGKLEVDDLKGKKILIADDDELNRLLLRTLLSNYKVYVDEAVDGNQALERAREKHYDLIITDIHMPERSGISLVQEIRQLPDASLASTPVIALTANVVLEDIQKYLDAGMNDYLLKPYKEESLIEKIAKNMHLKISYAEQKNGREHKKTERAKGNTYSLEELERVSNGNPAFVAQMVRSFVGNARSNIHSMSEQAGKKNWEQVGLIAHRLGPSCHKLHLFTLFDLLRKTERKALVEKDYDPIPDLTHQIAQLSEPVLFALETELKNLAA